MDKTQRLLDALDRSDKYSDEELQRLLGDQQLQDTLKTTGALRACTHTAAEPDIDKEWEVFCNANGLKRRGFRDFILRHAAAAAVIGFFSLCAIGAVVSISLSGTFHDNSIDNACAEASSSAYEDCDQSLVSTIDSVETLTASDGTMVFGEATLEEIVDVISKHYGADVKFMDPRKKGMRLHFNWDKGMSLEETTELLNSFAQLNIHTKGNTITVE